MFNMLFLSQSSQAVLLQFQSPLKELRCCPSEDRREALLLWRAQRVHRA